MPDLEYSKATVLRSLGSPDSQRGYQHAIDEFVAWYCSEPRLAFYKTVVLRYRFHLEERDIESGPLFRCVCRAGKPWGYGISEKTVWHVVKKTAASINIPRLAPHDLRRSSARLCHDSGGELEQIQFLLGHVSVQTTERYIGCRQRLRVAVNDRLGIEPG
jgi:integrase